MGAGSEAPDQRLRSVLPQLGWREDLGYGADGKDGTAFGFRRGETLCIARASWDGGDDADPTYVPDDRYELRIECMRGATD